MPANSFDCESYMSNSSLGHDQDIHYKMSKKIAQLTKVICMLNSQSEDSVDLLKETSKLHEDEINKLKTTYDLKISELQSQLEKEKNVGNTVINLEKSISEKELEMIKIESKYSQIINDHQLKEDMLKIKHNEEVIKLQQAFIEYKEKCDKELNSIQCFAEQWKSHQCPNIELILNEKLQLECEFKKLEEKHSSLEAEVDHRIETLTNSYEYKIQQITKNIHNTENKKQNELIQINAKLLNELKHQQNLYNETIKQFNEEKNELSQTIKNNTEINLNTIWQNRLNKEKEQYQIELTKLHQLNIETKYNLDKQIQCFELKYNKLNAEYVDYQNKTKLECENLQKTIDNLKGIEGKLKEELVIKDEKLINLEKEKNVKYLQLKKEYDELLEKLKTTEVQLEAKNVTLEDQLNKQGKVVLNSKYDNVRFKLKESRKLLKVSENDIKLLRKQISVQELSVNCLKENFKVKLQNMKQSFMHYLLDIEQIKINLSHIVQLLKQEIKIKYESYYHNLYNKKTSDLRRIISNEIEEKMNKEKEVSIKNITIVKENQIDHLQQINNELKLKMTRQCEEYENEIIQAKSKLEQVTYKLTKELEDCQLANKEIEMKLIKESEMKENLEKQLMKLSSEMDRIKKDYENLSKQAKLEKSSRFTDLVAELDRKWSETVGRECARVRSETVNRLELEYKTKLEELTNRYEETIINMNKQWEVENELGQYEANKTHQSTNYIDQEIEYIDKEISGDITYQLSKTSLENLDQSVQTDEISDKNKVRNLNIANSSTETDQRLDIEQCNTVERRIDQNINYEQEIRQKQNDLKEVKVNYDKLLEEFIHTQSTYEKIQIELKNQLKNERLVNEERINFKEKELEKHFQHELQAMREHYENIKAKESNEFILAQNILKSKIHELHQRLLGCSCESSKLLKQIRYPKLSTSNQTLPEITMVNKQNSTLDNLSSSNTLSPPLATITLSESTSVYNYDYNQLLYQLISQNEQDGKREEKFRLPMLTT
ncbi:hypothetical protein MN116_004852 [Schistosoma mekongi]|uniref:Protein FAM184A/B N-terminal domain-containing protein n=1 Tax=Schistosoma mekongi TaxID=38744 RepID=A0AAE1ZCQ9_SCHME|nr:hypothetical protein MN116_004852 [Schistosoma mekongi]